MAKLVRLLLVAALVAPAMLFRPTAPAVAQQAGGCRFALNGFDVTGFSSAAHALEVDATIPLAISVVYPREVGDVFAEVDVGPIIRTFKVNETETNPNADWSGVLDLSPQKSRALGLQRVVFSTSSGCQTVTWVKLTGGSPFATTFGITAIMLLAAGAAGIAWSLRAAATGRHSLIPAVVGSVVCGVGIAVMAQELAFSPLSAGWLVLWMVLPLSFALSVSLALARHYNAVHPEDYDDDDEDEADDYDITDATYAAGVPPSDGPNAALP